MPEFAYHAIDPDGREQRGRIAAANDDAARERLTSKRLYIVSVAPAPARVSALASLPIKRQPRLNAKQLTLFTRQMSSLAQVSPLEEALRTISRQSEQPHVRQILTEVHAGVVEGQRLSEAMRREGNSFPPLYRAMIAAGYDVIEVAGNYLLLQPQVQARQGGSYMIRLEGNSPLLVSVPAPIDEAGAFEAGVRLFEQFGAHAFASAGSARRLGNDGSSDVLKWPQTIFQVFHRELAPREVLQVRTHPEGVKSVVHLSGQLPESFDLGTLEPAASSLKVEFAPHPEKNLQRQTLSGQFSELWLSPDDSIKTVLVSGNHLADPRERIADSFVSLLRNSITESTVAPAGSELFRVPSQEKLLRVDREVLSPLFELAGADMSSPPLRQRQFELFMAVQPTAASLNLKVRWIADAENEYLLL